jgi:hypothetical protein
MAYDVELEEFKHLQAIIARHEDHAFKIRGVMYALLTALSAAVFTHEKLLSGWMFMLLGVLVIALFLVMEMVHRAICRLAIDRVSKLEAILRSKGEIPYDGPLIGQALGQHRLLSVMCSEVTMPWILIHYIGLLVAVAAIGFIGIVG